MKNECQPLSDSSLYPHHSSKPDKLWNVCFIPNKSPDAMTPEPTELKAVGPDAGDRPVSLLMVFPHFAISEGSVCVCVCYRLRYLKYLGFFFFFF